MVRHHPQRAVPGTLFDGDARAERAHQRVARARIECAELDQRALAAYGRDARGGVRNEDRAIAGEIGPAAVPVVSELLPTQCEPFTCSTNVNGPVPRTFFSYQCGSFARMSAL